MVDGEGALQPVGGEVPGGPEPAHVVDQHIQPRVGAADRDGESAYLGLAGHVGGERVHRRVAGLAGDPGGGGLGPRLVPAGDADAGAQRGQAGGGRPADAASAARDQRSLACHRAGEVLSHWGRPFV